MKQFYIVGFPVKHSLSPSIFNQIFRLLKIDASYSFKEIENEDAFQNFIDNIDNNILGFNVSLPHKEWIYKNVDCIDSSAKLIQSINCVKIINSKLIGYNTDLYGFDQLIKFNDINFDNKNILILGNGGAARAVMHSLAKNYQNDIYIWGRDKKKVDNLVSDASSIFNTIKIKRYKNSIENPWIVINCISFNIDKSSINSILSYLPTSNIDLIIDINYFKTPLMEAFKLKKSKIVLGKDMLIFQALKSFNIWFDDKYSGLISHKKIKEIVFK